MAGKPGEDRMSRSEAARAGRAAAAANGGGGTGGLSDKDITSGAGWGSNADPRGPTVERPTRTEPFAPSGANERWGFTPGTDPTVQKKQDEYNSAWDDRVNRGFGGWLRDHLLDVVPGFRQEDPNWNDPDTFKGGIYHDSWSPWGAAASLAGMAAPFPGVGLAAGLAGNAIADAAGAERYVFGSGWGPAVSEPGKTPSPMADAKEAALAGPPSDPTGRTANSGVSVPGPMQAAAPSIFNPTQPTAEAADLPRIFPRQVANARRYQIPGGSPYGINLFARPS